MTLERLRNQTIVTRRTFANAIQAERARADHIPPTWKNNLRWHAGHLTTTPHLLTYGLLGEPMPIPGEYRTWFAKGTSPATWGGDPVPTVDHLLEELETRTEALFEAMMPRADDRFPEPYTTSAGVILSNVEDALTFSTFHDGIHLGMVLALRRAL